MKIILKGKIIALKFQDFFLSAFFVYTHILIKRCATFVRAYLTLPIFSRKHDSEKITKNFRKKNFLFLKKRIIE